MKCQCTAAFSFLATIAILVGLPRFVRAGSNVNVFTNDNETSHLAEEPTENAVLNNPLFNNNVFIDDTAADNVVVAVARDPSNMLTNQVVGGYQGWFAFPRDRSPITAGGIGFAIQSPMHQHPRHKILMVDM